MEESSIQPLAKALNDDIASSDNCAFGLLSRKGRRIFFPSKGILGQSAEAKKTEINATIGTAFEEDGSPLCLECIEELINLPSQSLLYTPSYGLTELRERWKEMIYEKNPSLGKREISLPVVTGALTHALSVSAYLFADEGDKIILSDLNWDNYELIFGQGFGANLETYKTFADNAYNIGGLREKLMAPGDKKILLLNFPNNPSGYTLTEREALDLCDTLKTAAESGKHIVVILDDAYFGLVYEKGVFKESLFSHLADIHRNILAVKLDAPTKEDYVWGLRIGFMTFGIRNSSAAQYKALEAKAAGVVRGGISNCSSIGQHMLLKAFSNSSYSSQKESKYEILKKRYLKIREILAAHPEYRESFVPVPFNSGYFMCVKPLGADAEAVRKDLIESYGTGVIVLSGLIRIAFSAVPYGKLELLFSNIDSSIRKIK
ncbi:MAG: aminotransferase class I/II-fold pyridoxal phosphate-dependent enzyme [Victivallales bacterium]